MAMGALPGSVSTFNNVNRELARAVALFACRVHLAKALATLNPTALAKSLSGRIILDSGYFRGVSGLFSRWIYGHMAGDHCGDPLLPTERHEGDAGLIRGCTRLGLSQSEAAAVVEDLRTVSASWASRIARLDSSHEAESSLAPDISLEDTKDGIPCTSSWLDEPATWDELLMLWITPHAPSEISALVDDTLGPPSTVLDDLAGVTNGTCTPSPLPCASAVRTAATDHHVAATDHQVAVSATAAGTPASGTIATDPTGAMAWLKSLGYSDGVSCALTAAWPILGDGGMERTLPRSDCDGCSLSIGLGIRKRWLKKLLIMWQRHKSASASPAKTGPALFLHDVATMLLRYNSVSSLNREMQGSVPRPLLRSLRDAGCRRECFASPSNAVLPEFHSAFPDTDTQFGSLGSFFLHAEHADDSVRQKALLEWSGRDGIIAQLNPPFASTVMLRAVNQMDDVQAAAARSSADAVPVCFLFFGPNWPDDEWYARLAGSKACRAFVVLPANKHCYGNGSEFSSVGLGWQSHFDSMAAVVANTPGWEQFCKRLLVETSLKEPAHAGVDDRRLLVQQWLLAKSQEASTELEAAPQKWACDST